jgi:aspartyl-tRNA synthetase
VRGRAEALSKNILQNEYALRIAPELGAKGMTWMKVVNGRPQSNIAQFFSRGELDALLARFGAKDGDVLLMIADASRDLVNGVLCGLRLHLAERLSMIPADTYRPLWVTDFPLFELKEERIGSQHHPFTMPDRTVFDPADREELAGLRSRAYDLVVNGEELGGGSIRIHRMDIQRRVFEALRLSPEEIESKFGFFLRALEYGAPPHGGLALGLDRLAAMVLKTSSIRDVIAFPKNRSAYCPLTEAPSWVDPSQIAELGLPGVSAAPTPPGSERSLPPRERPPAVEEAQERISLETVRHVARLARLRVTEEEVQVYRRELNAVLTHFEALQALDTDKVHPMVQVTDLRNVWREDAPAEAAEPEGILSLAPETEKGYFKVPKILEG